MKRTADKHRKSQSHFPSAEKAILREADLAVSQPKQASGDISWSRSAFGQGEGSWSTTGDLPLPRCITASRREGFPMRPTGRRSRRILTFRRQFKIDGSELIAYFDTDIALQDDLLIESLSRPALRAWKKSRRQSRRSRTRSCALPTRLRSWCRALPAAERPRLCFNAWRTCLPEPRQLKPENVVLITPNVMFQEYIENVLPELGEKNPAHAYVE